MWLGKESNRGGGGGRRGERYHRRVQATILAVGSELLSTERLDTNSLRLTALLERYGVELVKKSVVGDLAPVLAQELRSLWETSDLVLVSGGLGPTADDLTREAAAAALGLELVSNASVLEQISSRFAAMGRKLSPNNHKQAEVLAGAKVLANPNGTAPGQQFERDGKAMFLFPGVPFELDRMAAEYLVPWLAARSGGTARETWTIKVAMRPESELDQAIGPAYEEFGREWITILAGAGEVRILLTAAGGEAPRRERLAAMRTRTLALLGDGVFGEGAATTLEGVVAALLERGGWTLATAESCTGGLVAERMTRVPGVSSVFAGGIVAYSNESKSALLGVPPELIECEGAVSEAVARAMAIGVCGRFGSDMGVSLTGIAGPAGGSAEKPVGTVHFAVAGPGDEPVQTSGGAIPRGSRAYSDVRLSNGARDAAPAVGGRERPGHGAGSHLSLHWAELVVGSYLLGSLSFSLAVVWLLQRADVRKLGSGNAGATNVLRAAGRWPALLVLLLDIAKGVLPVRAARALGAPAEVVAAAALAVIVGHIYPLFFGFRGGKGVATGFGALVALLPMAVCTVLAIFALTVRLTRYVSLGSILSAAALPAIAVLYARLGWSAAISPSTLALTCACAGLVIFRHLENLKRLFAGTEQRLGAGRR